MYIQKIYCALPAAFLLEQRTASGVGDLVDEKCLLCVPDVSIGYSTHSGCPTIFQSRVESLPNAHVRQNS